MAYINNFRQGRRHSQINNVEVPAVDRDLETELHQIVIDKHLSDSKVWTGTILAKLIQRLHTIADCANTQGNQFATRPEDIDLRQAIKKTEESIITQINTNFQQQAPFTIQRIAELIGSPEKQGYILANNVQIYKYFNSLHKLFTVSSTVDDFPSPTFSPVSEPDKDHVLLVEIPWLEKEPSDKTDEIDPSEDEEVKKSNDEESESEESDKSELNGNGQSPRRAREEDYDTDEINSSPIRPTNGKARKRYRATKLREVTETAPVLR